MASEPKRVVVEPGGELDRLLEEAAGRPIRLVRGGEEFRLDLAGDDRPTAVDPGGIPLMGQASEDDVARRLRQPPTPEEVARSRDGIRRAAGGWVGVVDAEALKAYIRERRRTVTRPPVRW